jgi:peptide/nickel transport system permease protein
VAIVGLSVPNFALGTLIIVMPTIWWKWSPPVHYTPFAFDNLWSYLSQYFSAAFVLGLSLSAALMRLSRTELLGVLREDYVRTARAKGLVGRLVVLRHALPNALIPVISQLGLQVGFLISGSVVIEQIFGLPGIGRLLLQSIATRDYPTVQAIALVAGVVFILVNLIVDMSYGFLNPKVRMGVSS